MPLDAAARAHRETAAGGAQFGTELGLGGGADRVVAPCRLAVSVGATSPLDALQTLPGQALQALCPMAPCLAGRGEDHAVATEWIEWLTVADASALAVRVAGAGFERVDGRALGGAGVAVGAAISADRLQELPLAALLAWGLTRPLVPRLVSSAAGEAPIFEILPVHTDGAHGDISAGVGAITAGTVPPILRPDALSLTGVAELLAVGADDLLREVSAALSAVSVVAEPFADLPGGEAAGEAGVAKILAVSADRGVRGVSAEPLTLLRACSLLPGVVPRAIGVAGAPERLSIHADRSLLRISGAGAGLADRGAAYVFPTAQRRLAGWRARVAALETDGGGVVFPADDGAGFVVRADGRLGVAGEEADTPVCPGWQVAHRARIAAASLPGAAALWGPGWRPALADAVGGFGILAACRVARSPRGQAAPLGKAVFGGLTRLLGAPAPVALVDPNALEDALIGVVLPVRSADGGPFGRAVTALAPDAGLPVGAGAVTSTLGGALPWPKVDVGAASEARVGVGAPIPAADQIEGGAASLFAPRGIHAASIHALLRGGTASQFTIRRLDALAGAAIEVIGDQPLVAHEVAGLDLRAR